MFVVVTIVAVFLAYHVNWIRQRHAFLARQRDLFIAKSELENYDVDKRFLRGVYGNDFMPAPWPLRLLGEAGRVELRIMVTDGDPPKDFAEYDDCRLGQSLFPESRIVWYVLP